jgi:hypothetical protein
MSLRINARLDDAHAERIERLRGRTGGHHVRAVEVDDGPQPLVRRADTRRAEAAMTLQTRTPMTS